MLTRTKALLTLVFLAPILTEIVSGNTPAHALLDPRVTFFWLVAYGLPLLVVRELQLRWQPSGFGVFLLGLAYGIWNEGLLAQTLIRAKYVPIDKFDHYIYAVGLNFSWAAVIVPWHALLAIMFPIALVVAFFPSTAQEPWLSKRDFVLITAILVALVLFISIARKPHAQMLICGFAIFGLVLISYLLRGRAACDRKSNVRAAFPFIVGLLAYPAFILSAIALAVYRMAPPVYFAVVLRS
jgi:hypothetical protein